MIVWINPQRVTVHAGSNLPYTKTLKTALRRFEGALPGLSNSTAYFHKLLYSLEPFSVKGWLLRNVTPIESESRYVKIADHIRNIDQPRNSKWYNDLVRRVREEGAAFHKSFVFESEADVREFFETYVRRLVESMSQYGYDCSLTHDHGTALIGEDGSILKTHAGNHRFSVARILGVPRVPLEILGAHETWMRAMEINDCRKLESGIRMVERMNQ